jgi:hypothetical protein
MLDQDQSRPAILFLCLGNICRSPLAEGAARAAFDDAGIDALLDSAGTGDWHVGLRPIAARRPKRSAAAPTYRSFARASSAPRISTASTRSSPPTRRICAKRAP